MYYVSFCEKAETVYKAVKPLFRMNVCLTQVADVEYSDQVWTCLKSSYYKVLSVYLTRSYEFSSSCLVRVLR